MQQNQNVILLRMKFAVIILPFTKCNIITIEFVLQMEVTKMLIIVVYIKQMLGTTFVLYQPHVLNLFFN